MATSSGTCSTVPRWWSTAHCVWATRCSPGRRLRIVSQGWAVRRKLFGPVGAIPSPGVVGRYVTLEVSAPPKQHHLLVDGIIDQCMLGARARAVGRGYLSPVKAVPHPGIALVLIGDGVLSSKQDYLHAFGIVRHSATESWTRTGFRGWLRPVGTIPQPHTLAAEQDHLTVQRIVGHA